MSHIIFDTSGNPILDTTGDPILDTFSDGLFSDTDYLAALLSLMPRGRVWPRSGDANQVKFLAGLSEIFADIDSDAQQLLLDSSPATTYNLLPEWEETLGLPDPCLGGTPTVVQRQASVLARFTASGGLSAAFYKSYAAALGYTITITPQAPFRMGISGMGDGVGGSEWFSVLLITSTPPADAVLECEMNAIDAAHQTMIFS